MCFQEEENQRKPESFLKNCITNFKSNKRDDTLVVAVALNAQIFE